MSDTHDQAYVLKDGKWVKPTKPSDKNSKDPYIWVPNKGWVNQSSQADEFGYELSLIKSDPSLEKVFNDAWADEKKGTAWSAEKFVSKIKDSTWYTSRTTAQREYDVAYGSGKDSPEYKTLQDKIVKQKESIEEQAAKYGINLTSKQLQKIATTSLRNGEGIEKIDNYFANYATTDKKDITSFLNNISGGTTGDARNQILDWAKNNGVSVSDSWLAGQLQGITNGHINIGSSKEYITSLAKVAYPAHANYISPTMSVMDRAQSYAQKISKMLELPFENVDLNNDHLRKALAPDQNGQPKNFTQIEQELRGTSDWAKTNNAKETVNGVVNNILNKFGLV